MGWDGFTLVDLTRRPGAFHIGNMGSSGAARAIADVIGETTLLARAGENFVLSSTDIRVRPIARAITTAAPGETMQRTVTGV